MYPVECSWLTGAVSQFGRAAAAASDKTDTPRRKKAAGVPLDVEEAKGAGFGGTALGEVEMCKLLRRLGFKRVEAEGFAKELVLHEIDSAGNI